jgi:hypothetical protein
MDLMSFQKLRDGLQLNVAPAPQRATATAVERLRSALITSGVFADVEIEPTGDGDRLVAGLCRYSTEHSEDQIVDRLTQIWTAELRYHGWDAHSLLVDEGHVELQAATVAADRSRYLTLHLIAQADPTLVGAALAADEPRVPEQRGWLRRALAGDVA